MNKTNDQTSTPDALYKKAHGLHARGQLDAAARLYNQVLDKDPTHADTLHFYGVLLYQQGKHQDAIAHISRALEGKPDNALALNNLGSVYQDLGDLEKAEDLRRRAVKLMPTYVEGFYNLGTVLFDARKFEEAEQAYRKALELKPGHVKAANNLSQVLSRLARYDEAEAMAQKAITEDADYAEAHCSLGLIRYQQAQPEKAISCFRKALELNPEFNDAHVNLGMALLSTGRFEEGWKEYEWRKTMKQAKPTVRSFKQPMWDGTPLPEGAIMLHGEQGIGDAIQFIRYAPKVAERVGKVYLMAENHLLGVLGRAGGISMAFGPNVPFTKFDVHAPLLSLPMIFKTDGSNIPADVPYISAAPQKVEEWREKLAGGKSPKVGFAWAGSPEHTNDRNRSMAIELWRPLLERQGVNWISLQVGERAKDLNRLGDTGDTGDIGVTDISADLKDLMETAAVMENLDLVISVDTAVVHLAGALARPVWTLLPFAPDWRWLHGREDTPWYPTMRLFRQSEPRNWEDVVEHVRDALGEKFPSK